MDKNFNSKDEMEKKETKRKCFITIVDSKESKPKPPEIKSTFFLILVIHNKEIINNHEHSSKKVDFPNNDGLKSNKDIKILSDIKLDQISNKKGKSKKKEIFFEISKNQNGHINKTTLSAIPAEKIGITNYRCTKKQSKDEKATNFVSPDCSSDPFNNLSSNQSETNFYVDIPLHSLQNNPNSSSIKVLSPGGSTCEDNSNLKSISYFEHPHRSSEITQNTTNLKFKIEIQAKDKKKTQEKKSKNNTKKPSIKSLNLLMKTYKEIKESKLLGKKRLNEEKVNLEVKSNEKDLPVNMYKVNFDYEPNNLINFSDCLAKSKNYNKKNIQFFKERLAFFKYHESKLKLDEKENDNKISSCEINHIINPFDKILRYEYAQSLAFQKKFQEEYVPIQLQKENENANISKTHFIKKKQCPLNIKRHCGVSYVLPSESKQLNVSDKYNRLGHLVYQGTYSTQQINEPEILDLMNKLIDDLLYFRPVVITYFESPDEDEMKEYLLFPNKRYDIAKSVYLLNSIYDLWKFIKDKYFLAINLIYDEAVGIRNYNNDELSSLNTQELLSLSNIHIGILFRKATSGMKSVLKLYKSSGMDMSSRFSSTHKIMNLDNSLNIDQIIENFSGSHVTTLSMRIELFVNEISWKNSNFFSQEFLFTFICLIEERISKMILFWNENRLSLNDFITKEGKLPQLFEENPFYTLNKTSANNQTDLNEFKGFNLDKLSFIKNAMKFKEETDNNQSYYYFNESSKMYELSYKLFYDNKTNLKDCLNNNVISKNNFIIEKLGLFNSRVTTNSLPIYIISTRDCFVFDLIVKESVIDFENRKIIRKEFFFNHNNFPSNYARFKTSQDDFKVGVVTYENFFSHEELCDIEKLIEETEENSSKEVFLPETAQKTTSGDKLKRTKFFFGSRYMWTKKNLAEPNSYVAAGIRKDVSPPPMWIKNKVENPLVNAGIILKDFINSYALNVYHDGSEGLGQHFDDAPIYTLRTFSDCRLSFGSQLYGFCNGAFTIPLPRGCVCVMEENSYASNGVKHCIRPCDMTGKSSALILRQMHPNMVKEAEKYDILVDFPCWFSTLSLKENAISYMSQKTLESEALIKENDQEKQNQKIVMISNINEDKGDEIQNIMNDMLSTIEVSLLKKKKRNSNKGGY